MSLSKVESRRRYLQLAAAAVVGYGVTGVLLWNAVRSGSSVVSWSIFATWSALFVTSYAFAYVRYSRRRYRGPL